MSAVAQLAGFAGLAVLSLPHCLFMCGPLAAAGCGSRRADTVRSAAQYQAGRMATYIAIGVVAASVGRFGVSQIGRQAAFVFVEVAAVVIVLQAVAILAPAAVARFRPRGQGGAVLSAVSRIGRDPLALGLATGFLPCGALAGAVALAVAAADPILGGAGMGVFALVTAPGLVAGVLAAASARRSRWDGLARWRPAVAVLMLLFAAHIAARPFVGPGDGATHCAHTQLVSGPSE